MPQKSRIPDFSRLLRTRRWLLVAPSLLLFWIIGQFDKTNISLVIADHGFLQELALVGRNTELGGLMSAFFIGYGVSIFFWGFLVDRFGPRACIIAGSIAWGAAMFMMSRATNLQELLEARLALGAAEGNMWPASNALTNCWFPTHEHSRAQAFWVTGSTLGTAIAVPVVSALMLASGWRGMMVGLALLSLVPIVLFSFLANHPQQQKRISTRELHEIADHKAKAAQVERMSFGELLKSTAFWLITGCMVVAATTVYTLVQWIPSFLRMHRNLPFQAMNNGITVGYVLATVATLAVAYVADRTMQRSLTAAWTCITFAVAVLPAAFLLPPMASAVLLSTLIAAGSSAAALNGALLHTLVRPEAVARGTGIYSGVGTLASAAGPLIFGASINALGGQYWGGLLFLAILNIAGAGFYFALTRIASRQGNIAIEIAPSKTFPSAPEPMDR